MSRGFQQRRSCKYIRVFFFRLHGCNYGRWMTTVYKLPSAAFAVQFVMKRRRRSSNACTSSRATLFFFCALAIVVAATNCQRCSTSKSLRFGDKRSQSAFVISRPALSRHQRHRSGRSTDATRSSSSGADSSADGAVLNGTMVHDDAWYLGDGGFAAKHLEDEDRISAKKVLHHPVPPGSQMLSFAFLSDFDRSVALRLEQRYSYREVSTTYHTTGVSSRCTCFTSRLRAVHCEDHVHWNLASQKTEKTTSIFNMSIRSTDTGGGGEDVGRKGRIPLAK